MILTRYIGGPYDAERLGRLRPEACDLNTHPSDSGPAVFRIAAAGGEYVRVSSDGAETDVYQWRDFNGDWDDSGTVGGDGQEPAPVDGAAA
jgi:hypothetical protein